MSTDAAQTPDRLSEVFQYLSSSSPAGMRGSEHAYGAFHSSYYTFHAPRRHRSAQSMPPSATHDGRAPSATAEESKASRAAVPLAPRVLSAAPAVMRADASHVGDNAAVPRRLRHSPSPPAAFHEAPSPSQSPPPSSPTPPQTTAPPPTQPSPTAAAAAAPAVQQTVPSPVAPKPRLVERPAELDFDVASVGSVELPVEQQPDSEFLSPVARQVCASSPSVLITTAQSSFRTGHTAEKSRELTSFGKLAFHSMDGNHVDDAEANEQLHFGSHTVTFPIAPHTSLDDGEAIRKGRSFSVASLMERSGSPVFATVEGSSTFPGVRRVSLRRPIFDEDDDLV